MRSRELYRGCGRLRELHVRHLDRLGCVVALGRSERLIFMPSPFEKVGIMAEYGATEFLIIVKDPLTEFLKALWLGIGCTDSADKGRANKKYSFHKREIFDCGQRG